MKSLSEIERDKFWSKVDQSGSCWLWRSGKDHDGYGRIWFNGSNQHAHRVAWMLTYGPIEPGRCVCHTCDTPSCVRPAHLFQGTHADNMADRMAKGRSARGTLHGHAKLTEEEVLAIRCSYRKGVTQTALARRFSVAKSAIYKIVMGQAWTHLPTIANRTI